jgi:spore coat polysaccharide biosynthesis protein SpsF
MNRHSRSASRVVASIEARMGSSRLPGKVLADIQGKPALSHLVDRLRRCRRLDDIVVATTTAHGDDDIEAWARDSGIACWRGSEDDVLQRVVDAQHAMRSDIVVEITGDCIVTDPEIVDLGIDTFFAHDCELVSNCGTTLTWPMGVYVQVFPFDLLADVAQRIDDPAVREHVSLYFYEHPEKYRLIEILAPERWRAPELRLQLDYAEDLHLLREIHARLSPLHGDGFGIEEIMALLRHEPELAVINAACVEKAARQT